MEDSANNLCSPEALRVTAIVFGSVSLPIWMATSGVLGGICLDYGDTLAVAAGQIAVNVGYIFVTILVITILTAPTFPSAATLMEVRRLLACLSTLVLAGVVLCIGSGVTYEDISPWRIDEYSALLGCSFTFVPAVVFGAIAWHLQKILWRYVLRGSTFTVPLYPSQRHISPSSMSAQSSQMNAYPSQINARSLLMNAHPSPMNAYPSQMNAHPSQMNAYPSQMNARPSPMNAHPSQMNVYPSQMNAHPSQMNVHPSQMNAYPSQMNAHPSQMNSYPSQMNAHPSQMNSHPSQMNSYPSQMNAYPSQMNAHPSQMNAHPSQMNAHPSQMNSHPSQMNAHPSQMNAMGRTPHLPPTDVASEEPIQVPGNGHYLNATRHHTQPSPWSASAPSVSQPSPSQRLGYSTQSGSTAPSLSPVQPGPQGYVSSTAQLNLVTVPQSSNQPVPQIPSQPIPLLSSQPVIHLSGQAASQPLCVSQIGEEQTNTDTNTETSSPLSRPNTEGFIDPGTRERTESPSRTPRLEQQWGTKL
ncbi:uncharacterized protein [Procambarus clarkii]|uniref:uncharacterized protein n=1 Tax=Procambarus clarkii TaxID=6728 RepID=UPI0037445C27